MPAPRNERNLSSGTRRRNIREARFVSGVPQSFRRDSEEIQRRPGSTDAQAPTGVYGRASADRGLRTRKRRPGSTDARAPNTDQRIQGIPIYDGCGEAGAYPIGDVQARSWIVRGRRSDVQPSGREPSGNPRQRRADQRQVGFSTIRA